MGWRIAALAVACVALGGAPVGAQGGSAALDRAFADFWKADNPRAAARAAEKILATRADFDVIYARLKTGRPYKAEKVGETLVRFPANAGVAYENVVTVPASYDPAKPMQVRVQLHGGIGRPAPWARRDQQGPASGPPEEDSFASDRAPRPSPASSRGPNRIAGEDQIVIEPSGWAASQWWQVSQVDNILRTLDAVKRKWNVDENRVYLTGISDGGTGAYYMAMKETTPWASFLPLNGSIAVLRGSGNGVEGQLHASNLVNKPLYIVNGDNDPLYPAAHVSTHVQWFATLGVPHVFRPQKDAGHDTRWWPTERAPYEAFVREHPRVPHPAVVSWETERTDRFNRAHWLVIERIGPGESDVPLELAGYFLHRQPSGRAHARRTDNTFDIETRDVRTFRLLLSPDVVDFAAPVTVKVNGQTRFEGMVKKDPAVLLAWAAKDNDRTMLYAAELVIGVP